MKQKTGRFLILPLFLTTLAPGCTTGHTPSPAIVAEPAAAPTEVAATASEPAPIAPGYDPDERYPRLSPFRAMRLPDKRSPTVIEVQLDDDVWYRWLAIDGVPIEELVAFARAHLDDLWWKRINEDLVQLLAMKGHRAGSQVALELRRVTDQQPVSLAAVTMTKDNRARLRDALRERKRKRIDPRRMLPAVAWQADLQQFEDILQQRFAYRHADAVDVPKEVSAIRARLGDGPVPVWRLSAEMAQLVARFRDGHALVRPDGRFYLDQRGRGFLPFLLSDSAGGVVAHHTDRSGFVDAQHPYVVALDGRPIEEWIADAERLEPAGAAKAYRRYGAVGMLRHLPLLRQLLGRAKSDQVAVELGDGRGSRITRTMPLGSDFPVRGQWPRRGDEIVGGDIGYLRIPAMVDDDGARIDAFMAKARATKGLIIDIRNNRGGTRDTLRHLVPYLLGPRTPALLENVATFPTTPAAAVPPGQVQAADVLASRAMFPADHDGWTADQRQVIADARARFRPSWTPPAEHFAPWHYSVLDRRNNPGAYHYDKPVIVLMNSACFSAADVFLGALRPLEQVTLMGTPSRGGSAAALPYQLRFSQLTLILGSVASFQPDGQAYDGHGVQPEIRVEPEAGYFIGRSDQLLDRALARLRQ